MPVQAASVVRMARPRWSMAWLLRIGMTWSALSGCNEYTCQDTASCEAVDAGGETSSGVESSGLLGSTSPVATPTAISPSASETETEPGGETVPPPPSGPCGTRGTTRLCSEAQLLGNCAAGTQNCQQDGSWSECSITRKAQDSCEPGDDADCDGTPNEGCALCEGGSDPCNTGCEGCSIDGACYADGAVNTGDACLVCDISKSTLAWSVDVGAACDDEDSCTRQDACNVQGECQGEAVNCTDDEGVCGATRSCDPSSGQCVEAYAGGDVLCTDGDPCTADDHCNGAGECEGTPTTEGSDCACLENSDCDDDVPCTTDTCTDGQCSWTIDANTCVIRGQCYEANTPEPNNACRFCAPASDNTDWSNASSATSCDDGVWCNGADTCDGQGACSHAFPNGNRCAGTTGACEVQTCNESKDNCLAPAGTVCEENTVTGCLANEVDVCAADVKSWPIQYTCSGTSPNCGTNPIERTDLATVAEACGSDEACHATSGECRPKLGCDTTYCQEGLCWTKANAPGQYAQESARTYCSNLTFAGETSWRLPTVAQMQTLVEGPNAGCYWPSEMGPCNDELWTSDDSQSFAFWVGTAALQISTTPLYVRCVTED